MPAALVRVYLLLNNRQLLKVVYACRFLTLAQGHQGGVCLSVH